MTRSAARSSAMMRSTINANPPVVIQDEMQTTTDQEDALRLAQSIIAPELLDKSTDSVESPNVLEI